MIGVPPTVMRTKIVKTVGATSLTERCCWACVHLPKSCDRMLGTDEPAAHERRGQ